MEKEQLIVEIVEYCKKNKVLGSFNNPYGMHLVSFEIREKSLSEVEQLKQKIKLLEEQFELEQIGRENAGKQTLEDINKLIEKAKHKCCPICGGTSLYCECDIGITSRFFNNRIEDLKQEVNKLENSNGKTNN